MYIATASTSIKFHEFPSGNVVYNYQPLTKANGPIRSISWCKDGNWLALVPHVGLTEIIGIKTQLNLMHTIQDVVEPSCATFQNGTKKNIALGTSGGQILLYDIKARGVKKRYPRTTSEITSIEFTAKDTHIIAGCRNGNVLLLSNVTNNLSHTFMVPNSESVSTLKTSTIKKNLIVAGSNEGVLVVWDINNNKSKFSVQAHKAPVTSSVFSPINADLILTAGLDRQFCFYDIVCKQRVASIPVNNSITAADYSRDGINFVLASQNGNIHVYDSRRITEPVQSFEAHNASIRHMAFQKICDSGSNSLLSIIKPDNAQKVPKVENKRSRVSLALPVDMLDDADTPEAPIRKTPSLEKDSFLEALGISTPDSEFVQSKCSLPLVVIHETPTNHLNQKSLPTRIPLHDQVVSSSKNQQQSSTPKFPVTDIGDANVSSITTTNASPVMTDASSLEVNRINNNASPAPISTTSVAIQNQLSTEDVRSIIKEELAHLKLNEIDFNLRTGMSQVRRMCLDMQMLMIKEFIKIENEISSAKECVGVGSPNEHYLSEENMRLRRRVLELENEILGLKIQNGSNY